MENTTFMLTLNFGELTAVKYLYWVIAFIAYTLIVVLNGVVIVTVLQHKSLQEPMYIFISVLCVNGLYGSSSFFPGLLINLLQENPSVSYYGCLTQAFCLHTYGSFELTILASMAYDRYVSICNPLRYNSIMTLSMVLKIVLAAGLYPIILISILVILTARLPLCGTDILKVYCDNWVCIKSTKEVQNKALQTCTPHLITIANFSLDTLCEILLHRFPLTKLTHELKVFISLQILVVSPLLNPVIYGLKMKEMKSKLRELLREKKDIVTQ
ncbi:putative olfactory receptor 13C6 [Hyla sarda]|uniref:putative olfactory receptor 13C6 n=1 Tax=Hyla sarda TaxID=327740 RepID=UPI0024C2A816|nr:putative olfactory receptor 13C6 [Hyla sarda]